MAAVRIGFIGFGEVASAFSKAMREKGARVRVYDILLLEKDGAETVQKRIQAKGIELGSLREVVTNSEYVLSTVTTQAATKAAKACSEYLRSGQFYVDLNSTSPSIKVEISKTIQSSGAEFVEGAILGGVGVTGARTRILTAGANAQAATHTLGDLGLNIHYYSPEIGKASMFKMLRSIFSKGLESIILELLIAAKRAGIEKELWEDITQFMASKPFDKIAANWVQTHAAAHERRYHEIVQVVETMCEIGVEPIMSFSTEAFFKRSLSLDFMEAFPDKPESFEEVVDFMEERLRGQSGVN